MAPIMKEPVLALASLESTSDFQHHQVTQGLLLRASTWAHLRQENPEDP